MGVCSKNVTVGSRLDKCLSCDRYLHGGNKSHSEAREISATDEYCTQYALSAYLLVPTSVIDLFLHHCAKIWVFNSEK